MCASLNIVMDRQRFALGTVIIFIVKELSFGQTANYLSTFALNSSVQS